MARLTADATMTPHRGRFDCEVGGYRRRLSRYSFSSASARSAPSSQHVHPSLCAPGCSPMRGRKFTVDPDGVTPLTFGPILTGAKMSQDQSATKPAGDKDPDPATAENPPSDIKAGESKREQGSGPESAAEAGVGGSD